MWNDKTKYSTFVERGSGSLTFHEVESIYEINDIAKGILQVIDDLHWEDVLIISDENSSKRGMIYFFLDENFSRMTSGFVPFLFNFIAQ